VIDLSGVVVNYNSAAFARGAVRSFLEEGRRLRVGGRPARVEAIVVDNASPNDEPEALAAIEAEGARLLLHGRNPGYAGGMNYGVRASAGRVLAILNPDIEFAPGALGRLFDYVEANGDCGAAGAKNYLDRDRGVILPRNHLPGLLAHLRQTLGHLSPAWAARYAAYRAREAHAYWTAKGPTDLDMLSGCAFLIRREVFDEVGGFDEGYPLYYEDADLFRALRRAGYRCVHLPEAEIFHFWSRSVSATANADPMRRFEVAQRRYFAKHGGPLGFLLYALCQAAIERTPRGWLRRPMDQIEDLGARQDPPSIPLHRRLGAFLAEIAGDPLFILAGGAYGSGDRFEFPRAAWEGLDPVRYYVRVLELPSLEPAGTWTVQKLLR
jgi:N-acetylglucosaminyl-diphospho-decaprenol L-rhamnosyltransferase